MDNLKPCPFCGSIPDLPSGHGTQYEAECNCGMAVSSVQISDLMTIDERMSERMSEHFMNFCYGKEYVERAKREAIKNWNLRPGEVAAEFKKNLEVQLVGPSKPTRESPQDIMRDTIMLMLGIKVNVKLDGAKLDIDISLPSVAQYVAGLEHFNNTNKELEDEQES